MWPLLLIAGSTLLKHKAERDAVKRQEAFGRAMEAFQRSKSAESMAATEKLLEKQTPQARAQEMAKLTAERAGSLRDTVAAATPPAAAPVAGKLSPDYERSQEAAANSVAERTRRAIQQLSAMGAPGEQQQKFAKRFGLAAGSVDAANLAGARVGRGYMTDIEGVRPDPNLMLIADLAAGVGMGMAAGGGGAAPAPAAGGTGITPGASGEGLRIGAGGQGLRPSAPWQLRLRNGFNQYGLVDPFGRGT